MIPVPELTEQQLICEDISHLPKMADIPDEFKKMGNKYNNLVSIWFYQGLSAMPQAKPGIDGKKAMKACNVIMRSWAPKHEHKIAGVAYLMSNWFDI